VPFISRLELCQLLTGFIAVIPPDFGRMPTETVFLGLIEDVHHVATANIVAYGGVTSGGVSLSKTSSIDCPLM